MTPAPVADSLKKINPRRTRTAEVSLKQWFLNLPGVESRFWLYSAHGAEFQTLEIVPKHGREFHGKKDLVKRALLRPGNHFIEVVRVFFAGAEKAPVQENTVFGVSLENESEYIPVVEEKLQNELRVVHLEGFSERKFRQIHFGRNLNAQGRILLEGDVVEAVAVGGEGVKEEAGHQPAKPAGKENSKLADG
ncbi:MAG: hypothetical protein IID18_08015 [Nitrospinae bacterium]|nr:hypothetical protein [Nitrospinota bacterium]